MALDTYANQKQRERWAHNKALHSARRRAKYASDQEYRETHLRRNRRPEHKARVNARLRQRRSSDPQWREQQNARRRGRDQRDSQLRTHYGISLTDYQRMFAEQSGACAICKVPATKTLAVDHCQATGAVRALLCSGRNVGLGLFKETPARLREAALYLEKHAGPK